MRLFTFVVARDGGTYISQHFGQGYNEAAQSFVEYAAHCEHLSKTGSLHRQVLKEDLSDAVAVEKTTNVLCATHVDNADHLWIINIIETVSLPSTRK